MERGLLWRFAVLAVAAGLGNARHALAGRDAGQRAGRNQRGDGNQRGCKTSGHVLVTRSTSCNIPAKPNFIAQRLRDLRARRPLSQHHRLRRVRDQALFVGPDLRLARRVAAARAPAVGRHEEPLAFRFLKKIQNKSWTVPHYLFTIDLI